MELSRVVTLGALAAGVALVGWIWLAAGQSGAGRPDAGMAQAGLLRPDDTELVSRGAEIYARACANCHGARLEGQPGWRTRRGLAPAHDETGHTWHHPDGMLLRVVREGTVRMGGAMPAFKGVLTEEEMLAVMSFIKSRWPRKVREAHDAINARAG